MSAPSLDFARAVRFLCGGLLVWAALFLFTYIFAAIACTRGFSYALWLGLGVVPLLLLLAAALSLGVLYVIARRADRLQGSIARRSDDTRRVVAHVATMVCGLALIAIVWNALALLLTASRC
ncbi:MAG: hypothetical protein GEV05_04585 [Betaproteobacteria bacterium]|nr:hypothetical protein [Betaproteobacteria bacterium]